MCPHETFEANVAVNRLEDIGGFAADVQIRCTQCNTPFRFLGLPGGLSPNHPTCSVDETEVRLPIMASSESRACPVSCFSDCEESMSNTQPLPDVTQPTVKPATSLERLVRIETLLLVVHALLLRVAWLVVIVLLLVAFVLGHVWR